MEFLYGNWFDFCDNKVDEEVDPLPEIGLATPPMEDLGFLSDFSPADFEHSLHLLQGRSNTRARELQSDIVFCAQNPRPGKSIKLLSQQRDDHSDDDDDDDDDSQTEKDDVFADVEIDSGMKSKQDTFDKVKEPSKSSSNSQVISYDDDDGQVSFPKIKKPTRLFDDHDAAALEYSRLEGTKKRLRASYEEIHNAKKQKQIQAITNCAQIPKPGAAPPRKTILPEVAKKRRQTTKSVRFAPLLNKSSSHVHATHRPQPMLSKLGKSGDKEYVNVNVQIKKPVIAFDDATMESRLESTKKRLRASYQEIQNAKKQRQIQVISCDKIPKSNAPSGKRIQSSNQRTQNAEKQLGPRISSQSTKSAAKKTSVTLREHLLAKLGKKRAPARFLPITI